MPENSNLKESLLAAYDIILQQTGLICDLQFLLIPLVQALKEDGHRELRESTLRAQESLADELIQTKRDSLDYVDSAIRRLRESAA